MELEIFFGVAEGHLWDVLCLERERGLEDTPRLKAPILPSFSVPLSFHPHPSLSLSLSPHLRLLFSFHRINFTTSWAIWEEMDGERLEGMDGGHDLCSLLPLMLVGMRGGD